MEKNMSIQQFRELLPISWVDEGGNPLDKEDLASQAYEELISFFKTKNGKKLAGNIRQLVKRFWSNGNKQTGMSFVDVMGTYVCGTAPKHNGDVVARAKRVQGQEIYAQGIGAGTSETLKEIGFTKREDNDYPTRAEAMIAIEVDSIGKKGPYDNGSEQTAINTCDSVLSAAANIKDYPMELDATMEECLNRRAEEYKRYVHADFHIDLDSLIPYLQKKGLSDTMRGFPFLSSGDKPLDLVCGEASLLMFRHVKGFGITMDDVSAWVKAKMTIDEFVVRVLKHLQNDLGLKLSEWYSLDHAFIVPISRDQGSSFKFKFSGSDLEMEDERGKLKYRLVTPISAFVQNYMIAATMDLVDAAPKTEGRIGLQEPAINDSRMSEFIANAKALDRILISSDFSDYDATLPGWNMNYEAAMYASLYDDPLVKDAMSMAGVVICQKLVFMTTSPSNKDKPYDLFKSWLMTMIKGDKRFALRKWAKTAKGNRNKSLRQSMRDEAAEKADFVCRLMYVYRGWLCSGFVLTNTIGSDCTLAYARYITPYYMNKHGAMILPETPLNAIASGDDCVQEVPLEMYNRLGYMGVLKAIEEGAAEVPVVINAKKQLNILYQGYPLVDFLQKVYVQMHDIENQKAYNKFLRQAPALPYKERYSPLYLLLQWVIVWGKLDSALCDENLDFAASIMSKAGRFMHSTAKKKGYRPPVPNQLYRSRSKLYWDPQYAISSSALAGMEQMIGLVKTYKQDFLASITRYCLSKSGSATDLVKDLDAELEMRAPHKAEFGRTILSAIADQLPEEMLDERMKERDSKGYISLVPSFLSKVEEFSGVSVAALSLSEPKIREDVVLGPESDDSEEEPQPDLEDNIGD